MVPSPGPIEVGDPAPGQHVRGGPEHRIVDLLPHALGDGRGASTLEQIDHCRLLREPIPAGVEPAPLAVSFSAASSMRTMDPSVKR